MFFEKVKKIKERYKYTKNTHFDRKSGIKTLQLVSNWLLESIDYNYNDKLTNGSLIHQSLRRI